MELLLIAATISVEILNSERDEAGEGPEGDEQDPIERG
jgi:hypothetical protein